MKTVASRLAPFAKATLTAPLELLAPELLAALPGLARAVRALDPLFHRQLGAEVAALMAARGQEDSLLGEALRFFNGPHDTLAEHEPFVDGVAPLKPGRAVYPEDLTDEALKAYVAAHPEEKEALLSPYTVVVREGDVLKAVPYATHYAEALVPVAAGLREAASHLKPSPLKTYLENRAAALTGSTEALLASNAEWVKLSAPLEVVIGPFETYADELAGQKAFYEAFLLAKDGRASAALQAIEEALPELAAAIPMPDGARPAMGGLAPLVVVDALLASGDGRSGLMPSAFNLPNDAEVRGEVGWKQVMIRNIMRAKFEHCTKPIASRVLSPEDQAAASFDGYFFHVLLHEVSHGLGPAYRADGRRVSEACGRFHAALEEAKADVGALVLLLTFQGRHGLPALSAHAIGASLFAGLFRSIRFGLHEAHGKANVVQFNWMAERGALVLESGLVKIHAAALPDAAKSLLEAITRLQASGAEAELEAFLARYGTPTAELVAAVEGLADLPVDICPTFPLDP